MISADAPEREQTLPEPPDPTTDTYTGLVIQSLPCGENSKMVTILTAKGLRTANVSGARGIKSKYILLSQVFSYGEYVVKKRGSGCYVRDVCMIENFYEVLKDPVRTALAGYFCDLAKQACVEEGDESAMLSLMLNMLYALSSTHLPLYRIKTAFEVRLMLHQGIAPEIECCAACGDACEGDGASGLYLDIDEGVCLCSDCLFAEQQGATEREGQGDRILLPLTGEARRLFAYLLTCPPKKIFQIRLPDSTHVSLGEISEAYLRHHLEFSCRALNFYKRMCADDAQFERMAAREERS